MATAGTPSSPLAPRVYNSVLRMLKLRMLKEKRGGMSVQ
jgi:hypothetical protein